MEEKESSPLLWGLVGCAGLCLVGLCGFFGFGVYLLSEGVENNPIASAEWDPKPNPAGAGPIAPPTGRTPPAQSGLPLVVNATVTAVSGRRAVEVGADCGFVVERHERPEGFWCRAQIVCGGKLLYGGPNAGYFDCELEVHPETRVIGGEDLTTREDSDAAMRINSVDGLLTVMDDATGEHGAYRLEARIVSIEPSP